MPSLRILLVLLHEIWRLRPKDIKLLVKFTQTEVKIGLEPWSLDLYLLYLITQNYLLNAFYMKNIVVGTGDTVVDKLELAM